VSFRAWKIKICLAPLTSCNCRISGNFVPMLSVFLKLDRSLHFTSTRMKNLRPNTSFIDPKANVSFKILLIFNTKFRFWSMHSKKKVSSDVMTSEKLFARFRTSRNQISREISLQNSHECGNNNPWREISNSKARRRGNGTKTLLGYPSLLP